MDVTIACVQMASRPGAVAENLDTIRAGTARAVGEFGAELVVFPECAVTGYPKAAQARTVAEPADGPVNSALSELAAENGVHLAIGVIESDGVDVFDGLSFFDDSGTRLALYRKVHLFSMERDAYTPGNEAMVLDTRLGRVGLTICYDLIFPEYIRALVDQGAEIVINATNWITDRWQIAQGWDGSAVRALARVRALENGVPVAMACLTGHDGEIQSIGHSTIAGPTGRVLAGLGSDAGIAAARIHHDADTRRWSRLATYRADRRPDVYR